MIDFSPATAKFVAAAGQYTPVEIRGSIPNFMMAQDTPTPYPQVRVLVAAEALLLLLPTRRQRHAPLARYARVLLVQTRMSHLVQR